MSATGADQVLDLYGFQIRPQIEIAFKLRNFLGVLQTVISQRTCYYKLIKYLTLTFQKTCCPRLDSVSRPVCPSKSNSLFELSCHRHLASTFLDTFFCSTSCRKRIQKRRWHKPKAESETRTTEGKAQTCQQRLLFQHVTYKCLTYKSGYTIEPGTE